MLLVDELRKVALLVFANKQDLPQAMTVAQVSDGLCLSGYYIQASCAVSGSGLVEGLDWLSKQILKQF
uniref:Uncharacterized protein n=1 Tax=Hippocampus comes TaxID=109280 RepID=A0A3Q2Z183_HIPCM